jgi:hypothetical protein
MTTPLLKICAQVGGLDGPVVELVGRDAWALRMLIRAGERGVTPIEVPGPRWSAYVYKLHKRGILIETLDDEHGGPFPGRHARYVLHSQVTILDQDETRNAA